MIELSDLTKHRFPWNDGRAFGRNCYWLCRVVYDRLGRSFPEPDELAKAFFWNADGKANTSAIHAEIETKAMDFFDEILVPEAFSIVSFEMVSPYTSHLGVVLDPMRFLHARRLQEDRTRGGVFVERHDCKPWLNRRPRFWRPKG